MMNLLSILILIIGGLNWASIGFLQYDFVAGFFGTQASIFSRLIYICIGIATLYFIFMAFKYKGNIKIFDRRKKYQQPPEPKYSNANVQTNPNYANPAPNNNEPNKIDILS